MVIPKTIHYCWFGDKPLGKKEMECIDTWKKYFKGYEIKCWNQENYDVTKCDYVREAYESKKWAFVSDYARLDILYRYGGVYFDTDVEVLGSFEELLSKGSYMGIESIGKGVANVNPGLGMAAVPGLSILKEVLDSYTDDHFVYEDGSFNYKTIVERTTQVLSKRGLLPVDSIQYMDEIAIYPSSYFSPINPDTGICEIKDDTKSIHHFEASWQSGEMRAIGKIKHHINNRYPTIPRKARSLLAWLIYLYKTRNPKALFEKE